VSRSLLNFLAVPFATGLAFASAMPAAASDLGAVRCSPNSDRVWVYESLNSFDVETRLKCGESVEILSRVRGYVKIRTASGVEGYVPDAAFPDLPALPPDNADKPIASVAVAARGVSNSAARTTAMPPPVIATPAPAAVASVPSSGAPARATIEATPSVASAAEPSASPTVVAVKPASAVAAPRTKSHDKSAAPTVVIEPAAPKKTPAKPAPSNTQSAKSTITAPQPSTSSPAMVPAKADIASASVPVNAAMNATTNATIVETSADASPKADIIIHETARDPDLDEYPDTRPDNESADPACRVFFSAYGIAPAQYKWLVENRRKEFAGICPAPDLARVDYVILFAHDSDAYTDAMPSPVHTDRNGFSDFSPLTTVDTALLSASALDKARYEFVWVFHTKRGTFDPGKFTARRRPLFTTDAKGSHASTRSVEDAFHFIEGQGSSDR
jgi:hypothetical protein